MCVQALKCLQTSPHKHQIGQDPHPSSSAQPGFPAGSSVLLGTGFPLMVSYPDADPGGSVAGGNRAVFVSSVHGHLPCDRENPHSLAFPLTHSQQIQDLKIEGLLKVAFDVSVRVALKWKL